MPTEFTADAMIRLLTNTKEAKIAERRRASLTSDITHIHLALGAELACEELERAILNDIAAAERAREMREQRRRLRVLKDQARQLKRVS